MIKKIFFFFLLFSIFTSSVSAALAQELPEKSGVYNVPGNPKLKLWVFAHDRGKPAPTPPAATCTDNDSASVVGPTGWRLPPGSWGYRLNTASVPSSVGSANIAAVTTTAFDRWSTASTNAVTFSNIGATSTDRANLDGQNIIAWGRTQGTALGVTYTWYDRATGLAIETDTIMNKKFSWSLNICSPNSYDAQDILTHELGHWMGLNDEYDSIYVDNTMYGYGSKGEVKKSTPATGDIFGIQNIYQ
ncbi:MAG: matrixin family metalloprotease [Patescibacteria group bacterium]